MDCCLWIVIVYGRNAWGICGCESKLVRIQNLLLENGNKKREQNQNENERIVGKSVCLLFLANL